jgi:hypothetical protein
MIRPILQAGAFAHYLARVRLVALCDVPWRSNATGIGDSNLCGMLTMSLLLWWRGLDLSPSLGPGNANREREGVA